MVNQVQSLQPDDNQQELDLVLSKPKASKTGDVTIQGVGNLLTHMAGCCQPVPGDHRGLHALNEPPARADFDGPEEARPDCKEE